MLSDEEQIMQVICRETQTFAAGDFTAWAECWVQDHRTREVCFSSSLGVTILEGWDQIAPYMQGVFAKGAMCELSDFVRENVGMTISENIAFVNFDGKSVQLDGRVEHTFETRFLEQHDGEWRILYSSFVLRGHQRDDDSRIALNASGKVVFASERMREILNEHEWLQISAGRLRARHRDWDRILQTAIQCAAEQHKYFQQYRYAAQHGRSFRLPVVLGETDSGSVAFCTLSVRDELTFVSLPSEQDLADRLHIARAIYGLSDGQTALAQRIVGGDSLPDAAHALGVSVNTLRTQLTRIYDKTGVNSQAALVRALLSVG
ncbi:LuxR family transcriptional regulator [Loktanella sp. S4079]|nr:LuxR family transcriptional regulator [Loktanella sp. S4079]